MFGVTIHRKECCKCCLAWNSSVVDKSALIKMAKKTDLMSFLPWKYIMLFASHDGSVMRKTLRLVLSIALCWPWLANNTFWRFFSTVLLWKLVLCQIFIKGIQLRSGVHMGFTFWAQKVILFAQFVCLFIVYISCCVAVLKAW